jgi:hypothetical protein
MMRDLDSTDPGFVDDLRESREAVQHVAQWLVAQGVPVLIRPTYIRPDQSQRSAYSDVGDLEIQQRVEVKRRFNVQFTCADDFPYPTIIVDVCHTYDNARPKPFMYVIVNHAMTHAAIILCRDTAKQWVRSTKMDSTLNREREFYECPISLVRFTAL